jgi:hypothetical protein
MAASSSPAPERASCILKDTDGDDKADVRIIMLQGLDSSDTHHGANNLVYGPRWRHLLAERRLHAAQSRASVGSVVAGHTERDVSL